MIAQIVKPKQNIFNFIINNYLQMNKLKLDITIHSHDYFVEGKKNRKQLH